MLLAKADKAARIKNAVTNLVFTLLSFKIYVFLLLLFAIVVVNHQITGVQGFAIEVLPEQSVVTQSVSVYKYLSNFLLRKIKWHYIAFFPIFGNV